MSEYELADYTSTVMGNFLSSITIYFSIITAYVVTAFVAGIRLTKSQLAIVNITFSIAAGIIGTLAYLIFDRFYELATVNQRVIDSPIVDFAIPLALLIIIMYIGSIVFMWTIRSKSDDA